MNWMIIFFSFFAAAFAQAQSLSDFTGIWKVSSSQHPCGNYAPTGQKDWVRFNCETYMATVIDAASLRSFIKQLPIDLPKKNDGMMFDHNHPSSEKPSVLLESVGLVGTHSLILSNEWRAAYACGMKYVYEKASVVGGTLLSETRNECSRKLRQYRVVRTADQIKSSYREGSYDKNEAVTWHEWIAVYTLDKVLAYPEVINFYGVDGFNHGLYEVKFNKALGEWELGYAVWDPETRKSSGPWPANWRGLESTLVHSLTKNELAQTLSNLDKSKTYICKVEGDTTQTYSNGYFGYRQNILYTFNQCKPQEYFY